MAGIGLRLHELASRGRFKDAASAYVAAAVISGGPWLSTVVAIALLAAATAAFLPQAGRSLLFATVAYAFAGSMIATGGVQLVLARFLADRLYLDERAGIGPACDGVLALSVPIAALTAPFLAFAPFEPAFRILVSALFVTLCLTWLVMVFLSAAREHGRIVLAFAVGSSLGVSAAIWFGHRYGAKGSLFGFTLGQVVCLALLVAEVRREFPGDGTASWSFLRYAGKYPALPLIGILYMSGIWTDNAVYWFRSRSIVVAGFYRILPAYDVSKLLAYLTTIPMAAIFLVHLESEFYGHYRSFFARVRGDSSLDEIEASKAGMVRAIRDGLRRMLAVQAVVAAAAIALAPAIVHAVRLPHGELLFRVQVFAGPAQFLLLVGILMLLYLDDRRAALAVAAMFAIGNACFTLLSLGLGDQFRGAGYLTATVISAAIAFVGVRRGLRNLEYRTYMLQPA